jgi:hypothetical protein
MIGTCEDEGCVSRELPMGALFCATFWFLGVVFWACRIAPYGGAEFPGVICRTFK